MPAHTLLDVALQVLLGQHDELLLVATFTRKEHGCVNNMLVAALQGVQIVLQRVTDQDIVQVHVLLKLGLGLEIKRET
jgi:aromatic ring-cleaving dioxygenase